MGSKFDYKRVKELGYELLQAIGEDPDREGLKETPRRFANWWREFIEYEPGNVDTEFAAESLDQMITVSGIKVWSLCEHHLLPFWSEISIGYIPRDTILGLSKFGRIAHKYAHRLQVQERLTEDIANAIQEHTHTPDIAVVARGEHLCMTARGIKSPSIMSSSVMRGAFRNKDAARDEFFKLVSRSRN